MHKRYVFWPGEAQIGVLGSRVAPKHSQNPHLLYIHTLYWRPEIMENTCNLVKSSEIWGNCAKFSKNDLCTAILHLCTPVHPSFGTIWTHGPHPLHLILVNKTSGTPDRGCAWEFKAFQKQCAHRVHNRAWSFSIHWIAPTLRYSEVSLCGTPGALQVPCAPFFWDA